MKKIIFVLLVSVVSISVQAQLSHTAWKGAIKGDNPQSAVLKFGRDTLILSAADGSTIETMKYSVKDNILSIRKLSGQSDCDNITVGKYKFDIKDGTATITLVADNCPDRSSALDKTAWKKAKL